MSKFTGSTEMAVLAVAYIAKHQQELESMIRSEEIAKYYGFPYQYLLKIMQGLVRNNILRSKRGPRGGFCLNRAAVKISLLEVVTSVDGPFRAYHCGTVKKGKAGSKLEQVSEVVVRLTKHALSKVKVSTLI